MAFACVKSCLGSSSGELSSMTAAEAFFAEWPSASEAALQWSRKQGSKKKVSAVWAELGLACKSVASGT